MPLTSVVSPGWSAFVSLGKSSPEPDGWKDIGPIPGGAKAAGRVLALVGPVTAGAAGNPGRGSVCCKRVEIGTGANAGSSGDGIEVGALLFGGGGGEEVLSDVDAGGGAGCLDVDVGTGADDPRDTSSIDEVEEVTVIVGTKCAGSVTVKSTNKVAVMSSGGKVTVVIVGSHDNHAT